MVLLPATSFFFFSFSVKMILVLRLESTSKEFETTSSLGLLIVVVQNICKANIGHVLHVCVFCMKINVLIWYTNVASTPLSPTLMGGKEMCVNTLPLVDVQTYSNTYSIFNLMLLCRIVYRFLKSRSHYLGEWRRQTSVMITDSWA